ncbi:MAG: nucleotidyltransferase family protein [Fimbriimonadales bacterium]
MPKTRHRRMMRPPQKEAVKAKLRLLMPTLRQKYRVRSLALFGSVAREEAHALSDIDLLVEFDDADNPVSLLEFIDLRNYLSRHLRRRVDLVEPHTLRPAYRPHVLREAEPV